MPHDLPAVLIGVGDLYCCKYGGCPHGLSVVLIGAGLLAVLVLCVTYTAADRVDAPWFPSSVDCCWYC